MKVNNPHELVGKEVFDADGNAIGWIDKTWNSWNHEYPGYFFGIKPNESTRHTYFRGTHKLIPIYSDYICEVGEHITLNKTMNTLFYYWTKPVPCGPATTCPTDHLVEMSIYDKHYSRIGTLTTWVETDGVFQTYGCFIDPFLCQTWNLPYNTLMPIPTTYITHVTDTVTLDKSLHELREYWKQYQQF